MVDASSQGTPAHVRLETVRRDNNTITVVLDSLTKTQRTVAKVAVNNLGSWISTELQDKTLVCTIHAPGTRRRSTKNIIDRRVRSATTSILRVIRRALAELDEGRTIN